MVSERVVIAQALPASGSLRLGCRHRGYRSGAAFGKVELYLFRMWADLDKHGVCEDGTVVRWNAQDWGLTSPRAREEDPNLYCGETDLHRFLFVCLLFVRLCQAGIWFLNAF